MYVVVSAQHTRSRVSMCPPTSRARRFTSVSYDALARRGAVCVQGPGVPVELHGSLNKNPSGLKWVSPMFSADLKGRFIQEVTVKANEGFPPAMSCLIAYVTSAPRAVGVISKRCFGGWWVCTLEHYVFRFIGLFDSVVHWLFVWMIACMQLRVDDRALSR